MNNKIINTEKLHQALKMLNEQLAFLQAPSIELVICGGSALIATGLVPRTTQDIDIIALMEAGQLKDSFLLPSFLLEAAERVRRILHLPPDWLNNGPASQFQMGLPTGFCPKIINSCHWKSSYSSLH